MIGEGCIPLIQHPPSVLESKIGSQFNLTNNLITTTSNKAYCKHSAL